MKQREQAVELGRLRPLAARLSSSRRWRVVLASASVKADSRMKRSSAPAGPGSASTSRASAADSAATSDGAPATQDAERRAPSTAASPPTSAGANQAPIWRSPPAGSFLSTDTRPSSRKTSSSAASPSWNRGCPVGRRRSAQRASRPASGAGSASASAWAASSRSAWRPRSSEVTTSLRAAPAGRPRDGPPAPAALPARRRRFGRPSARCAGRGR